MAVTLPGTGDAVAADVIGTASPPITGQYVQWVKIDMGGVGLSNPVSSTNPLAVGAVDPATISGTITVADSATAPATNSLGQVIITGSPTALSFVSGAVSGCATARIQLMSNAAATGTVVVEKSFDGGTHYLSETIYPPSSTVGANVAAATFAAAVSVQEFLVDVGGATNIRVRATALSGSSPSVTVNIQPGYGPAQLRVGNTLHTNSTRNAGVLHRSAITSIDKVAVPVTPTLAAVTEAGSTLAAVAYNVTVSAGNLYGPTGCPATAAITPTANQAIRCTITAVTGATYYDIFLSTGTSPLWVGRITSAQLASGGFIISTVGTVTSGGGAGAGAVDLGIVGTGVASNTIPFAFNNAYLVSNPTAINCAGYSKAYVMVALALTDLRSLPTLTVIPFRGNQAVSGLFNGAFVQDAPLSLSVLSANGTCLYQEFEVDIDGSTSFEVLIDTISGQGAAASIWVELA
jgi:hypothetical protein